MKKYTTPEVEIIKFQVQETIADDSGVMDGSAGKTTKPSGWEW